MTEDETASHRVARWRAWALRPVASDRWDRMLWVSGGVSLAGIGLASFVPFLSDLAVLFSLTLLVNGPWSIFTPVAYEPILMTFGQVYPGVLVAVVGVTGQLCVEYVNYHLYNAAMHTQLLTAARESAVVRKTIAWFSVQPFWTVFMCALTPLPFWIARIAAPLAGYPMRRYLTATALGRFPRLWFYAALGMVVPVRGTTILAVGFAATVILAALIAARRARPAAVAERAQASP